MRHGDVSYEDRKIKCLQELACWVTDLTLWGNINLNNFKTDILAVTIEGYRNYFEDKGDRKG